MSFINDPDITKEEVLKESYCNWKKRRLLLLGS